MRVRFGGKLMRGTEMHKSAGEGPALFKNVFER